MNSIWHNNALKDKNTPIITVSGRALRGDGVFDTALAINGKICNAHAHFTRLIDSAAILEIKITYSAHDLIEAAQDLLQENDLDNARCAINTTITRGNGARGLSIAKDFQPHVIIRTAALPDEFSPINAIISKTVRRNEGSPLSQIKSINYGDNIMAMIEAEKAGANEAIMLNNAGNVACATIGNIFIMRGGHLYTPPLSDGAMAGTVRDLLIQRHGAQEQSLRSEDLTAADGIYITNSIRGIAAITSLNDAETSAANLDIPKDVHE